MQGFLTQTLAAMAVQKLASFLSLINGSKRTNTKNVFWTLKRSSFTPLVMSVNGGFGKKCTKFYGRLAKLTATKKNEHYSKVL